VRRGRPRNACNLDRAATPIGVPRGLLACVLVLSACARPGAVIVEPAGAPAVGQLRVVSDNVNFGLAGDLEEILRILPYWPRDRLEGHPDFYPRARIRLAGGLIADTYPLHRDQVVGRPLIDSNHWRTRAEE
jgi:hypothetical protein